MKKITPTALLLLFALAVNAQSLIYETNFPAGNAPTGWTTENLVFEGECDWYYGDTYLPGAANFSAPAAIFNDDICFDETSENRLISPVVNIYNYDTVSLSFEYGLSQTNDGLGTLTVEAFDGNIWTQIWSTDQHTVPVSTGPIDMTPLKNINFQVRFTYDDEGAYSWGAGVSKFRLEGTYGIAPNNLIENAIAIPCGQSLTGSTALTTVKTGLPVCSTVDGNTFGVWYKYTNPLNQANVTVSLCESAGTNFDSRLSIFKGETNALACVTANDNTCGTLSSASFLYDGYSDYYILVSGAGATTGDFTIKATCTNVPPENDAIVNAIDVDQFAHPYTHHAIPLIYATTEADFADLALTGCDTGQQQNVFYKFTTVTAGEATVSMGTPNPGGFTLIMFYTAPNENASLANLTWVDQGTNLCNVMAATRTINTEANTTYYVTLMQPDTNSDVNFDITGLLASGSQTLEGFSYYPNPVKNELHVNAPENIEKLEVYNLLGQLVRQYSPNAVNAVVNTDAIAAGTYVLKAVANGKTGTYKIVIQ